VCRVTFDAASESLYFDGKEHDASASADGEVYLGKTDATDGHCHFGTRAGMEVYSAKYAVLEDNCSYKWGKVSELKTDVVTVGDGKMLLCAATYPSSAWQIGWVDTTAVEEAAAPLPSRRMLEASPSPSPKPGGGGGRKMKKFKMTMQAVGTLADFTESKKDEIKTKIIAWAAQSGNMLTKDKINVIVSKKSRRLRMRKLSDQLVISIEIEGATPESTAEMESSFSAMSGSPNSFQSFMPSGVTVTSVSIQPEYESEGIDGGILALIIIGSIAGVAFLALIPFVLCKKPNDPTTPKQLGAHNEMHKSDEAL